MGTHRFKATTLPIRTSLVLTDRWVEPEESRKPASMPILDAEGTKNAIVPMSKDRADSRLAY